MKEGLCRPDENHWCTECCIPNCPLLGDTGDGKKGCLGHNGQRFEGLTERSICLETDCLASFSPEEKEVIRKRIIFEIPPGQFRMSEAIATLFLEGRREWKGD